MSCLGMGKISFRLQSSERWKLAEVQVPLENTVTRSSARQAKHKHRPLFAIFRGTSPNWNFLLVTCVVSVVSMLLPDITWSNQSVVSAILIFRIGERGIPNPLFTLIFHYLSRVFGLLFAKMSVVDKLDAARHSITGSYVAKVVCKASSREVMGPKRKHLDCKLADWKEKPLRYCLAKLMTLSSIYFALQISQLAHTMTMCLYRTWQI